MSSISAPLATPGVRRARWTPGLIGVWIVLAMTTLVSLYPLYGMYVTALTPTFDTVKTPPDILPIHATIENFQRLLVKARDYPRWFSNSLLIALSITGFHVFFDTLAGYAFTKKRFPGRDILFAVLLATLMIPPQVTLVPLYVVIRSLGLLNNVLAVILPGTARVLGIFLMRQYIRTLPTEIEEAARIDGASEIGIFWHIILPLCQPAMAALAIFTFVFYWNDFIWPLITLQRSENFTLPVGVASLQGEFGTDYGVIFAGAALAALPILVFFLLFQRYFLEGVRLGALKG